MVSSPAPTVHAWIRWAAHAGFIAPPGRAHPGSSAVRCTARRPKGCPGSLPGWSGCASRRRAALALRPRAARTDRPGGRSPELLRTAQSISYQDQSSARPKRAIQAISGAERCLAGGDEFGDHNHFLLVILTIMFAPDPEQ